MQFNRYTGCALLKLPFRSNFLHKDKLVPKGTRQGQAEEQWLKESFSFHTLNFIPTAEQKRPSRRTLYRKERSVRGGQEVDTVSGRNETTEAVHIHNYIPRTVRLQQIVVGLPLCFCSCMLGWLRKNELPTVPKLIQSQPSRWQKKRMKKKRRSSLRHSKLKQYKWRTFALFN